jgi:nucleoside-diphosphate-sugar epimerase
MTASEQRGTVLVTGGAGYVGATVSEMLRDVGHPVRVLDSFLHDQHDVATTLKRHTVEVVAGDIRDAATRQRALEDVSAVVHLAAIVGDPACAHDPRGSHDVNIEATQALVHDARSVGVHRFVFASTCSNYGRMADPSVPIDEDGALTPVSLYAEQKVAIEKALLNRAIAPLNATCLRFATVYGVAPRMRFDLTVNQFTRDLWAQRELEVFGEQFWRPYVHVSDAARAVTLVLEMPVEELAGEVFNVGRPGENYRKLDLVREIHRHVQGGSVRYVRRDEDPRDYKVSFEKIRRLGFKPRMSVPAGIAEVAGALSTGMFDDPFDARHTNS